MKRYYIVPPGTLPQHSPEPLYTGEHHYIDLDSHPGAQGTGHRVLVIMDEKREPHPDWEELPHLLDGETTLGHPAHARHLQLLQHLPCKVLDRNGKLKCDERGNAIDAKPAAEHGMYQLAKLLQSIHPLFRP